MAMQRDGHSDDRTKAGVSGRTPPVIEGEATVKTTSRARREAAREAAAAIAA